MKSAWWSPRTPKFRISKTPFVRHQSTRQTSSCLVRVDWCHSGRIPVGWDSAATKFSLSRLNLSLGIDARSTCKAMSRFLLAFDDWSQQRVAVK
ncbi:hypothetical protein PAXRUDRAFT_386397 [Paxillus rubicundulus Ve08.2h10]|uniref:Unplaced genomic scaffold scaffold_221, whole genome shotgun sequence n=1 Tax=Paxillus rubicundulus Ve08.2h10 TaxID=930991 RepID=A0A0D0DDN7_9AGAM|nr:hypothetical protein PAXRUDRAFT_386397 [Paxillus rubicundulus Ve08.2h10]